MVWGAPIDGGAPTTYVLQAALDPAFTNIIHQAPLGAGNSFTVPGVPPGTYHLRILARNTAGDGPPSETRTIGLTVGHGCTAPPQSPTSFTIATLGGNQLRLSWVPAASPNGGTATDFVIQAALEPSFSTLVHSAPIGGTSTSLEVAAPVGTFYVRVLGRNACGVSAPSNTAMVSVP